MSVKYNEASDAVGMKVLIRMAKQKMVTVRGGEDRLLVVIADGWCWVRDHATPQCDVRDIPHGVSSRGRNRIELRRERVDAEAIENESLRQLVFGSIARGIDLSY